jgi:hypothetical protein
MKHLRLKSGMSLFACAACALGLLLWARLLLVSSPPRIATADPAPQAPLCKQPDHKAPAESGAEQKAPELLKQP